jgi:hypothetical protein
MPCGTLSSGVGSSQYLVIDTFTDVNGTDLTSHKMDLGPGWTTDKGGDAHLTIESNEASTLSNTTAGNAVQIDRTSDFTVSADWIPTSSQLNISNELILDVRVDSGGVNTYSISLQGNGVLSIATIFGSTFTNRASTNIGALTAGSRYTVSANVAGNTITASVNGGNAISYTDSTNSSNGFLQQLVLNGANGPLVAQNFKITSP